MRKLAPAKWNLVASLYFSLLMIGFLAGSDVRGADALKQAPEIHQMTLDGKYVEADAALVKLLAGKNVSDSKEKEAQDNLLYLQAMNSFAAGDPTKSLSILDGLLIGKPVLEEEMRDLRAQVLDHIGKDNEAATENRHLLEMSPNFHLKFEANLRWGRSRGKANKWREARNIFALLEKKARGTPGHPEVMIELARAEKHMGNSGASCKWDKKLYRKHPTHPMVENWGPVLADNELDGKKTGCANSREDFRDRVRSLMWAGQEEKARHEVEQISVLVAKENRFVADELRAWFLLQNGEPDEAYKLLEPSVAERSHDAGFLSVFSSAAARSGNGNASVGAFYQLWKLNPKGEKGRKALYQSAFLSYQFQDYDGAARRFREFMQKYPRSSLNQDARWNLAWISYLKKDFEGAKVRFAELANTRRAGGLRERARYWMAMSLVRLERPDEARPLLESIAKDKSGSYYGTVARQRLKSLPKPSPKAPPVSATTVAATEGPGTEAAAGVNAAATPAIATTEETESEESLAREDDSDSATGTAGASEEATTDLVQETGRSDILEEPMPLKAPANAHRFERARALARLGLMEEARWELFEIERKTQSKDELKSLIAAYEELGQWHRSSTIAQLRFGQTRINQGFEGARALWESSYPRAFASDVKENAAKNDLAEEFVWGIMRAESQYRRDAVSPVGALGLMQMMQGTALKVAGLKGEKDFKTSQLLQPDAAIRLGSYYLKRLSKQFDDSIPLTAAAYNAGPHRVHAWLLAFGNLDMDEFIEHIPFLETREYVRKVVANALTYASLYKGRSNLVDLATPVRVKGKPEYAKREMWASQ